MKLATVALISLAAVTGFSQGVPQLRVKRQPIQIKIRHADPWAVKTLLEGGELRHPELSTILALMGGGTGGGAGAPGGAGGAGGQGQGGGRGTGQPGQGGQGGNGTSPLFPGGKFIVNPGDNSLWFIPDSE